MTTTMNYETLEEEGTHVEPVAAPPQVDATSEQFEQSQKPERARPHLPKYLIIALAILLVLGLVIGLIFALRQAAKPATVTPITINTQTLDTGTLTKLTAQSGSDQTNTQLTITPDTLFKNTVEIQGATKVDKDLDVIGNLRVNGTTTLQSGVGINGNLAVRGSISVSGALSVTSLNVGELVVTSITASGDLSFGGHLLPSGATPTAKISVSASGGTISISGNDSAGTVTITIGNGAVLEGEMAIITFNSRFATVPKVQLTPINGPASKLDYYASRSPGFFTINTSNAPVAGERYVFDYLVTQ